MSEPPTITAEAGPGFAADGAFPHVSSQFRGLSRYISRRTQAERDCIHTTFRVPDPRLAGYPLLGQQQRITHSNIRYTESN